MKNTLKEKLARKEKPIGTFFELGSPSVVEALGRTGLDFVILDNEHGPFEAESTRDFARAAENVGLTALARVREVSRPAILKLLDIGVQGVIVPDVHTVEEVQKLVDYTKYYPTGKRGFCPSRKDGWGFDEMAQQSVLGQMAYWNREILLIPQCETVGALEHIEEIVSMEGVDGIFVGPFDLSISMGIPGQFEKPEFQEALARVHQACQDAGKFSMIFTGNAAAVAEHFNAGFDSVAFGLDAALLVNAYRSALAEIKKNI